LDCGGQRLCFARVTFPASTLKAKIDEQANVIEKIKNLAGGAFTRLFVAAISYKPIETFREEAVSWLPKAAANNLIKLCHIPSAPRFSFETMERETV
jgi:hypothetical protein